MSRSHGSSFPPVDGPSDAKAFTAILRGGMGETDWSIQPTLVDASGIHYLATCHCANCIEIRAGAYQPSPREEIEQLIAADEAERRHHRTSRSESVGLRAWRAKAFPPTEKSA